MSLIKIHDKVSLGISLFEYVVKQTIEALGIYNDAEYLNGIICVTEDFAGLIGFKVKLKFTSEWVYIKLINSSNEQENPSYTYVHYDLDFYNFFVIANLIELRVFKLFESELDGQR
jgi:hypothetical protein